MRHLGLHNGIYEVTQYMVDLPCTKLLLECKLMFLTYQIKGVTITEQL